MCDECGFVQMVGTNQLTCDLEEEVEVTSEDNEQVENQEILGLLKEEYNEWWFKKDFLSGID